MEQNQNQALVLRRYPAVTPQSVVGVVFRRRRTILITFAAVFVGVLIAILVVPLQYPAEMKVLVERERFDPVVTSNTTRDNMAAPVIAKLTDEEVNSEVDLLHNQDLLRDVVVATRLQDRLSWLTLHTLPDRSEATRIEAAVRGLSNQLDVEPPNKSNLITINYQAKDPQLTASVLQNLADSYLEKHLSVHRRIGQSDFYQQQVHDYGNKLEELQAQLVDYTKKHGVIAADTEKQEALQKLADFQASLQTTRSAIRETEAHIREAEAQLNKTALRRTTMVRTSPALLEQLKQSLFAQEQQRTLLLQKYAPNYRLVQDLEKQIAETRAAIAVAEAAPTSEQTTDVDPTYDLMAGDLAKSHAELATMKARAASLEQTIAQYRSLGSQLTVSAVEQNNLSQLVKAAQENYLNAVRKQEESRMSDDLDQRRIVNVAIAEHPAVPRLPKYSRFMEFTLGLCLTIMVSLGAGFAADYWDPTFRTPDEMLTYLQVPVLASLPHPDKLPESMMRNGQPPLEP